MATLNVLTDANIDAAIPEYWSASIMYDADRDSLFSKLKGPDGSGAPIVEKDELVSKPGDQINFTKLGRLVGAGVTGTTALEGSEEKMTQVVFSVTVDEVRHGTAFDHIATVEAIWDTSKNARRQLADWLTRYMDDQVLSQVFNTDTVKTMYAGGKTTRASLGTGDLFVPAELKKLHMAAQRRGVTPFQEINAGKFQWPVYCAALSEADFYQLTADPDFREDNRLAQLRGENNPVVSGYVSMYQGIMLAVFSSINNGDGVVGSYLRPEAVLATALTAGESSPTTITTGTAAGSQVTNVDYYKYMPQSGTNTLLIDSEKITYTAVPGNSSVSGTRAAGGTTQAAHSAGALITLNNNGRILLFGKQFMMRAFAERPTAIKQTRDYEQELGLGIRFINGVKGVQAVDGTLSSAIVMETYSPNPSSI